MTTARAFDTGHARHDHGPVRPPAPDKLEDTGLTAEFIADLLLKTLYVQGARTGQQLMDVIRLPFDFIDHRMLDAAAAAVRGGQRDQRPGPGRLRVRARR